MSSSNIIELHQNPKKLQLNDKDNSLIDKNFRIVPPIPPQSVNVLNSNNSKNINDTNENNKNMKEIGN